MHRKFEDQAEKAALNKKIKAGGSRPSSFGIKV